MSFIKKYYNIAKYILYPLCRSITGKEFLNFNIIKKNFQT